MQGAGLSTETQSGVNTPTSGQEELGIEPQTLVLVDDQLCFLSHGRQKMIYLGNMCPNI